MSSKSGADICVETGHRCLWHHELVVATYINVFYSAELSRTDQADLSTPALQRFLLSAAVLNRRAGGND